jgi:hypothetical protein
MTAALRPDIPDRRLSFQRRTAYSNIQMPRLEPQPRPVVRPMPQPRPLPIWVKLLLKVQKGSSVMTFLLMGTVLLIYGWTVFTQQRWGREYRHWEALQKHEQQLMATNEVLKNQMAQQAENPKVGLVAPDPSSMIFLAPAAPRPAVQVELSTPDPIPNKPLGY